MSMSWRWWAVVTSVQGLFVFNKNIETCPNILKIVLFVSIVSSLFCTFVRYQEAIKEEIKSKVGGTIESETL